jgi:hypothetical protein
MPFTYQLPLRNADAHTGSRVETRRAGRGRGDIGQGWTLSLAHQPGGLAIGQGVDQEHPELDCRHVGNAREKRS